MGTPHTAPDYEQSEAFLRDMHRLDWIEEKASKGQVQIAKSLIGTGYEVAICRKGGMTTVDVYGGSFRDAIDGAMGDYA